MANPSVTCNELWVPVAMTAGRDSDDIQTGMAYHGDPLSSKSQARAEARRMCDAIDGIGFTVRRIEPLEVSYAS